MSSIKSRHPDFEITDPPELVAEKLRLAKEANKLLFGEPSLCDEFLEDRRLERERELRVEGY
ncbi:MAG: hypothetical protein ABSA85_05585 [Terracidiphilus sp.]|jgi:hypothetical protein